MDPLTKSEIRHKLFDIIRELTEASADYLLEPIRSESNLKRLLGPDANKENVAEYINKIDTLLTDSIDIEFKKLTQVCDFQLICGYLCDFGQYLETGTLESWLDIQFDEYNKLRATNKDNDKFLATRLLYAIKVVASQFLITEKD